MDRAEWNGLADDFEESVCDIVASETNDQLRRFVSAARPLSKKPVLVDLGCGIGSFIRSYGGRFDKIIGVEYAPRIMARAQKRCAKVKAVEWLTMDVARAAKAIGCRADLTVCLNVITSASTATRNAQWASVATVTKPTGFALVVVPSLESDEMLMEAHEAERSGKAAATPEGLADRDGSRQKHYRRAELIETFGGLGLEVKRLGKVFSPWAGEGFDKPSVGDAKGPWDWICLAQRMA
jgi:2-polyprenyl-3-methyl-5-hydroxy-6-metoxy-1,4-benzoquinol methylase